MYTNTYIYETVLFVLEQIENTVIVIFLKHENKSCLSIRLLLHSTQGTESVYATKSVEKDSGET